MHKIPWCSTKIKVKISVSNQTKNQGNKRVEETVVPSIVEEPNQNGKNPNDEGILKALKDLEWEISEILTEKVCLFTTSLKFKLPWLCIL